MDDLEKLQKVATKKLTEILDGPKAVRESKDALNIARLALGSLSAVGRLKATDRARDGVQLAVLNGIAGDKEEFKEFVAASMPDYNPVKLLPRPKK